MHSAAFDDIIWIKFTFTIQHFQYSVNTIMLPVECI